MGADFWYNPPDGGPEVRLKKALEERDEARAEVARLRQYEPPVTFQGTELVWDDTARARAERDEARAVARETLDWVTESPSMVREMLEKYPWLKENSS